VHLFCVLLLLLSFLCSLILFLIHASSLPQNPVDNPFVQIQRAAHVVKGAASNLMCSQLRDCAKALETTASANAGTEPSDNPEAFEAVKQKYEEMKTAVEAYHKFLTETGI
jgi:chemotaxis protein histidine kinase CheA